MFVCLFFLFYLGVSLNTAEGSLYTKEKPHSCEYLFRDYRTHTKKETSAVKSSSELTASVK